MQIKVDYNETKQSLKFLAGVMRRSHCLFANPRSEGHAAMAIGGECNIRLP